MSCFVTPAATAIISKSVNKKIPAKYHLEWLNAMLWGGTLMLVVEHIVTGEKLFEVSSLLKEELTVGLPVTLAVIVLWLGAVFFVNRKIATKEKIVSI